MGDETLTFRSFGPSGLRDRPKLDVLTALRTKWPECFCLPPVPARKRYARQSAVAIVRVNMSTVPRRRNWRPDSLSVGNGISGLCRNPPRFAISRYSKAAPRVTRRASELCGLDRATRGAARPRFRTFIDGADGNHFVGRHRP
jgi:hypothetical protein